MSKPRKILCPYCFTEFNNTEAMYQCTNKEYNARGEELCPSVIDNAYNEHWKTENVPSKRCFRDGTPFKSRIFSHSETIKQGKCPQCGSLSNHFVCPTCHNWLPTEMVQDGSEIISIIGSPSSGKTVYYTSLITVLKKFGYRIGLATFAKDEAPSPDKRTSKIYEEKRQMIFNDHILPDQTSVQGKPIPLIFKVTSQKKSTSNNNEQKGRSIYLVLYDTAGEIFDDMERMNDMAKYLKLSSGIILLVDPFSVNKLQTTLEAGGVTIPNSSKNATIGLDKLLGYMAQGHAELGERPLAITFSKFDAVINGLRASNAPYSIDNVDLEVNSGFLKTGKYDPAETDMIDQQLRQICDEHWDLGSIFHDAQIGFTDNNIRMFAVSALGINPEGNLIPGDPKPYRVLDPLVWILMRMGGFDIPSTND